MGRDTNIRGYRGLDGEKGMKGLTGEKGTRGAVGADGSDGAKGAKGEQGEAGLDGSKGPVGPIGVSGTAGAPGADGVQGVSGVQGPNGAAGPKGNQGQTGLMGVRGSQGVGGVIGETGPTGFKGAQGATGASGIRGPAGLVGETGLVGQTGPTGPSGVVGQTGATGLTGPKGVQGATGPTGVTGATGIKGLKGEVGATGLEGVQGVKGVIGATGLDGETGPSGAIGEMGIQGDKGPTGTVGGRGARGADGAPGVKGENGDTGDDKLTCDAITYHYLFRNSMYIRNYSANATSGNWNEYLPLGRKNYTVQVFDNSTNSATTIQSHIDTPKCTTYCGRVIFAGYGMMSPSAVGALPLTIRTLDAKPPTISGAEMINAFYWLLPHVNTPLGSDIVTNSLAITFRCSPPQLVVGWVTTFTPRSSQQINNLSNRCIAYVRIDFEGRVHAYTLGTCNPVFSAGSFDFFSHLDFNGLSYVTQPTIGRFVSGLPFANDRVAVYNPDFYIANFLSIQDNFTPPNNYSSF